MFSSAVIVFREVFEVALILGVLMAATRGLEGRNRWVSAGIGLGVLGSVIVAAFASAIASFADGIGQEIFNASVLMLATLMIGWTVVWMRKHGREIAQNVKHLGHRIVAGDAPKYGMAIVVALAVLREGSEIVLFSFGALAAGTSLLSITGGGVVGFAGGCAIGMALYYGLLKIHPRYLFSVTSWLLIFLAAGMTAQAAGFLVQSGVLPALGEPLWDSSWLVADGSLTGKILHALIGYTAMPSGIQVVGYAMTVMTIALPLRLGSSTTPGRIVPVAAMVVAAFGVIAVSPSPAHATKKVYAPYVEKGEVELEHRGGYLFDDDDGTDGAFTHKYAIGYGVTDYWFTELYAEFEKEPHENTSFEEWEWENRFQFFEPGEYWLDSGLLVEYAHRTHADDPDKIEAKLLLEKDIGKVANIANIGVEREIGPHSEDETEWGISWSSRYRLNEYFEPGFEIHSEFGEFGNSSAFDDQDHRIGPVIYGKLFDRVKYDVGYLFGLSDGAPDGTLKWIIEYEFRF